VLATAALQMLFGGLAMLAVALARHEQAVLTFSARTAAALAYLTLIGAVAGFSAYTYALRHLPIVTVSLYAYVNPVIAVLLGTLILSEPLNARLGLAAGIVLAGMALVRHEPSPTGALLHYASAAEQSHQEQHDRDDQEHVYEVAHRVSADQAEQPQHDENDRDRFEHGKPPFRTGS
jgi:uncharacterized membrane protein